PGDTLLLIEVSESSLEYDRSVKLPFYAGAGIPEIWILDLAAGEVESHSGPRPGASLGGYGTRRRYGRGEEVLSQTVPGLALDVSGILGG
ncbi:MAG: Uma2 family endonuclease, partial [Rubrobacter sp.]|nr:Uma2 family endonuclease [Rubrobacter sp.]